jgi:hypothetical protein
MTIGLVSSRVDVDGAQSMVGLHGPQRRGIAPRNDSRLDGLAIDRAHHTHIHTGEWSSRRQRTCCKAEETAAGGKLDGTKDDADVSRWENESATVCEDTTQGNLGC